MALTELQRRLNEKYNPNAFRTRRDLFPKENEIKQKAEEARRENEAAHLAVRALLLGHAGTEEEASQQEFQTAKNRRKKNSKSKAKSRGRGKP